VHIYSVTLAISRKDVVQLLGVVRDDYFHFTQIAAGAHFTGVVDFLIAAWGDAIGILRDGILQIIHPQGEEICEWEVHRTIVQISTSNHVVLLGDDGTAHALGRNDAGQCDLPDLEDNVKFTEVAAGWKHSVLMRSDGTAAACGSNDWGQCNIPPLSEGVTYTHVAAGAKYTICNTSDGNIVVCGLSANNQDIAFRAPGPGTAFAAAAPPSMLLQATLEDLAMIFRTASGEECWRTSVSSETTLKTIWRDLKLAWKEGQFGRGAGRVDAVLPGGRLLTCACAKGDTVSSVFGDPEMVADQAYGQPRREGAVRA
ncbi:unnamed protein product, partial [Prorocentrum cordatum]